MIEENFKNSNDLGKTTPATDIVEKDNGFYMFMDLPGVTKQSLDIDIEDNVLIVTGKAAKSTADEEEFLSQEFGDDEYSRRFTLAAVVDHEDIKASLKNGVLELFLPKKNETKPRKIKVSYNE